MKQKGTKLHTMLKLNLKFKLIGLIGSLIVIILTSAGILIIRQVEKAMDNENHKSALAVANDLARFSSSALISHDLASLRDYVKYAMKQCNIHHAIILDPHGRVIMHNKLSEVGKIYSDQLSRVAINIEEPILGEHYYSEQRDILSDIVVPIEVGGTRLGTAIIGRSHAGIEKEIGILKRQIEVMVFVAILVGMVFAVILATCISGPLKKLRDDAFEIGKGKRDISLKVESKDEIGDLVSSFNKMATDLRNTMVSRDSLIKQVTDRKRAEENLRAAVRIAEDERLKSEAIIESIGEPLSIIDTDFRFLFQNKVHRDFYGEHIGEHCYKAIKNRDEVCEGCQMAESFSDGKIHTKERIVPREEGPLYVVNTASPLRDSTGEIVAGVEVIRDITELKRSEEMMRESKEKLAGIIDSVTDQMIMVDAQLNIVWANDIAKTLFGLDLVGKKCYSVYHERDEVCEPCIVKQSFKDGKVHEFETEVTRPGGKRITCWCTASVAARDNDGRPKMVVEFLRDISDWKQAQIEIKTLTQQIEFILGATKTGLDIIDSDYNIRYIDAEWEKVYGDPAGRKCYEYFMGESGPCPGCRITKAMKTKTPVVTEEVLVREGNRPIQVTTIPFQNERGEWLFAEVNVDITERKQAEAKLKTAYDQAIIYAEQLKAEIEERKQTEIALRESEGKLNAMLQSIGDHMSMMDKDLNIIWANEIAMKVFGNDIIGKKCFEAYRRRKEPCEPYPCLTLKAFQDGKIHEHDTQVIDKDGKTTHFHCTANVALRDKEGKPTAVIEISRDITASKRAEEEKEKLEAQLRQAQKMEAIGTLAGGISHDFNNILQGISGYSQLLLMQKGVDDPDSRYLNQIDKLTQKARELTKQLLIFSRKVESNLRPVYLNQEVIQVHNVLKRMIPKMIDIELHLAEDLKLINADPVQLEQIMMNLGINAKDAMPDGGKLIYEIENVILDEAYCQAHLGATRGKYVLLTISDTGHGMDKEILEHIFEPFYTTKEIGKGTGLGLAMVYGIVKSHGGYITCYSEPGQGTVFRIYFPALEVNSVEQEVEPKKEAEIRGGHERILFVEDEETQLDIGKDMLNRYGYTTITAENGERAIEIYKLEKDRIDLVVLDIGMPGMGGYKCLQELLKIDPEAKVIIATGYPSIGKVKEMLESGAAGFVGKPYRLTDMLEKVRGVLDQG